LKQEKQDLYKTENDFLLAQKVIWHLSFSTSTKQLLMPDRNLKGTKLKP